MHEQVKRHRRWPLRLSQHGTAAYLIRRPHLQYSAYTYIHTACTYTHAHTRTSIHVCTYLPDCMPVHMPPCVQVRAATAATYIHTYIHGAPSRQQSPSPPQTTEFRIPRASRFQASLPRRGSPQGIAVGLCYDRPRPQFLAHSLPVIALRQNHADKTG